MCYIPAFGEIKFHKNTAILQLLICDLKKYYKLIISIGYSYMTVDNHSL